MKLMQLIKKKLWSPTIEEVRTFVIILGAVLACSAPFVHMLFPKTNTDVIELRTKFDNGQISEEEYTSKTDFLLADARTFGFPNPRKFWYAVGKPMLLLYLSFYLIFLYPVITDDVLKKSTKILSFLLCFVAFYFITWTFWYRGDFPKHLYYVAIGFVSILSTAASVFIIRYNFGLKRKIQLLVKFISVDSYEKYIKDEDKENYLDDSFTVYDEITK